MSAPIPKLGPVTSQWGQQNGRPVLILQNALGLSSSAIALPVELAMLPALFDGERDVGAVLAALLVRAGIRLSDDTLQRVIQQMDDALLFDNERFANAYHQALGAYRQADGREPVAFSLPPEEAQQLLGGFAGEVEEDPLSSTPAPLSDVRGLLSPHIDYGRGGEVYPRVWLPARAALAQSDRVVILGTDHRGEDGIITLTRQSYRTPWGVLSTDSEGVHLLAARIGEEVAFAHELHHAVEHSVELAAVWVHFLARDIWGEMTPPFRLLPVLCGSFAPFVEGEARPEDNPAIAGLIAGLRDLLASGGRTLIVAAADLAHIGPAFGGAPVGLFERGMCRAADERLLTAICAGDADAFIAEVRAERDRRNVCGIPPLYVLLRVLAPAGGVQIGYAQCPADEAGTSMVSIAGALLW